MNIGRDRADTSRIPSNIRNAVARRVTLLRDGTEDSDVMERLMLNPTALGVEGRYGERVLYNSVIKYVRGRDGVPDSTEIFVVDPSVADQVTSRLEGAQIDVHVVGAERELWTYASNRDLSEELMVKTFTQVWRACKAVIQSCGVVLLGRPASRGGWRLRHVSLGSFFFSASLLFDLTRPRAPSDTFYSLPTRAVHPVFQLPDSDKRFFQEELKILEAISPSGCEWVLGEWPGDTFKDFMGQSKRYFEDSKSCRNLVPAKSLKGRAYFTGLCLDAWGLSDLDPLIFMENVSAGLTENRVKVIVKKAKQQAASGTRLLVGLDADPDTSLAEEVGESRGGWCGADGTGNRLRPVEENQRQQAPTGQFFVIGVASASNTSPAGADDAFPCVPGASGGGMGATGSGGGGDSACADGDALLVPFPTASEIQDQIQSALHEQVLQWVEGMSDAFYKRTTNLSELLAQVFLQCQALVARRHQRHATFFLGQAVVEGGAQISVMDKETANFMLRHLRRHHRALYPVTPGGGLETACCEVVRELAGMVSINTERDVELEVDFLNQTGVKEVIKEYLSILVNVTLNPPLAFDTDCGYVNGFDRKVHAYSVDGDVVHPGETCVVVFPALMGEPDAGKGLQPIGKKYILPMTVASGALPHLSNCALHFPFVKAYLNNLDSGWCCARFWQSWWQTYEPPCEKVFPAPLCSVASTAI